MKLHILQPDDRSLNNCYVFETDNHKLLVIDGGLEDPEGKSEGYLWPELQRLFGMRRPHIDAWIFSHPHRDHISEFCRIVKAQDGEFGVRRLYYRMPPLSYYYRDVEARNWRSEFEDCVNRLLHDPMGYARYPQVTPGDSFELDGLRVDFLRVFNPNIIKLAGNNSSLVFRVTAAGQTFLFLGDLAAEGGHALAELYGDQLKSDVVQMAHHGQGGVRDDVYDLVQPKICLFPTPVWVWENRGKDGPGTGNYKIPLTLSWPSVAAAKHHVSGIEKTVCYELPMTE